MATKNAGKHYFSGGVSVPAGREGGSGTTTARTFTVTALPSAVASAVAYAYDASDDSDAATKADLNHLIDELIRKRVIEGTTTGPGE